MKPAPIKVLLIEDNPGDARLIAEMLGEGKWKFALETSGLLSAGMDRVKKNELDLVLLDLNLPDSQGLDTFVKAREKCAGVPIIVLTGTGDEEMALEAVRLGAQDYLVKGQVSPEVLVPAIRYAIERKKNEDALRESEERFRTLFDNAGDAIFIHDLEGCFLEANHEACERLGYSREELLKMAAADIDTPEWAALTAGRVEELRKKGHVISESIHVAKDGKRIPVEVNSRIVQFAGRPAVLASARDVTARRALEHQLNQAVKMEAVGLLAGGVAHDFNNNLTPIFAVCGLLLNKLNKDHPLYQDLLEIRDAAERCASLIRQLMAFGRKQILEPKVINLNDVVTRMEKILIRTIGEDVGLVKSLESKLHPTRADAGQIEQIIVNLAVNARDAMPQGGKLTIETQNVSLDEEYCQNHLELKPGEYVMLAMTDTGTGMGKSTQQHIFEPFFTTKEKGKGTGLGLSTVYGIVKQSGGNIELYSELGKGTTFKIYLPASALGAETAATVASPAEPPRGSETIMVVEDNGIVRKVMKRILKSIGYSVIEAGSGEEAVRICEQSKGKIDLLITDMVMPGMTGRELSNLLTDKYPGLKVIFVSGYTDDAISHHGVLEPGMFFIQKPFVVQALAEKIREALDR